MPIKFIFATILIISVLIISDTNAYSANTVTKTLQLDANCRNSISDFFYDSDMYPTEENFTTTQVSVFVSVKVEKGWDTGAMDTLPVQVTYSLAWNDPRLAYGNLPGCKQRYVKLDRITPYLSIWYPAMDHEPASTDYVGSHLCRRKLIGANGDVFKKCRLGHNLELEKRGEKRVVASFDIRGSEFANEVSYDWAGIPEVTIEEDVVNGYRIAGVGSKCESLENHGPFGPIGRSCLRVKLDFKAVV